MAVWDIPWQETGEVPWFYINEARLLGQHICLFETTINGVSIEDWPSTRSLHLLVMGLFAAHIREQYLGGHRYASRW